METLKSFQSFLQSLPTVACLLIRLAIVLDLIPVELMEWLNHRAFSSLFHRPVQQDAIEFMSFNNDSMADQQRPILLLLAIMLADLLTAFALIWIGNVLRTQQDKDDEEQTKLPATIQPKHKVFAPYEESQHQTLFERKQLPQLSAHVYLLGTLLSSSASRGVYSGLLSSFVQVISSLLTGGSPTTTALPDTFLPIFLIPIFFAVNRKMPLFILLAAVYWYETLQLTTTTSFGQLPTFTHPNLGVQFYFTMQLFDRFQSYFGIMFWGLRYILILPLAVRLYDYPMELATCYCFVYTLFHSHPTVTDLVLCLSLMLTCPRTLARLNTSSLISICALPVPLILYLVDVDMWLVSGNGNANFVFFQALAYNAFVAILFVDFVGATVERDIVVRLAKLEAAEAIINRKKDN